MTTTTPNIHDQLRAWARGMYTTEAATELLIRAHHGTFVDPSRPWISNEDNWYWIDFASIPEHLGALSGGEQRLLRIAASIGSDEVDVNLSDDVTGLDRANLNLVLAAIAHAGGSHQHNGTLTEGNSIRFTRLPALHTWDGQPPNHLRQNGNGSVEGTHQSRHDL